MTNEAAVVSDLPTLSVEHYEDAECVEVFAECEDMETIGETGDFELMLIRMSSGRSVVMVKGGHTGAALMFDPWTNSAH